MVKPRKCGCCGHRVPGKKCGHCQRIQLRRRDNHRLVAESKARKRREAAFEMAFLPQHARREIFEPYAKRQELLEELGFESYEAYLQSGLWKSIRYRVLGFKAKCVRCDLPAGEVHHSEYTRDNLSGTTLEGLHPVCRGCHKAAELRPSGNKRSLRQANAALEIDFGDRLIEQATRVIPELATT